MRPLILRFEALVLFASIATAQSIELVSLSSSGAQGDFDSVGGAVSADGRFVAFSSSATNFSANDPNGPVGPDNDVYLRDRATGTTTHVSSAFDTAFLANISADGAFVTFNTNAQTSAGLGITRSWIWERATGIVQPISPGDLSSIAPELSADGRYVAFVGRDATGTNPYLWPPLQAYVLDRASGTITLASRTLGGSGGNGAVSSVSISADGARVAFGSHASDLVPNDTNGVPDVFVFETATQVLTRVSVNASGGEGDGRSEGPSLSADGRLVAFFSQATNLVAGDTNQASDLFRYEISSGNMLRLSLSNAGNEVFGSYGLVKLSADGRLAFFSSNAPDLVPGDGNNGFDVFVRDTANGTTRRLSQGPGGLDGNVDSWLASISPDGRYAAFFGYVSNLVANDVNTVQDSFLIDIGSTCSSWSYCTSLPNSTGNHATIGSQNDASLSVNNLRLSCVGLPSATIGRFFFGTSAIDPGTAFGNGLRCVGGNLVQLSNISVTEGVAYQVQDLSSAVYTGIQPGEMRFFQFIHRNPAAGGAKFNTSDALAITFCP